LSDHGRAIPPDDDPVDADPGSARERTNLAWTRSAISFAALGALLLKSRPAFGIPLLIFSIAIWEAGHVPRKRGVARRRMVLVTAAVTTAAALAFIVMLLNHASTGLRL
jgi:uncharacterized membrane protein YidH (DUF202 family)